MGLKLKEMDVSIAKPLTQLSRIVLSHAKLIVATSQTEQILGHFSGSVSASEHKETNEASYHELRL